MARRALDPYLAFRFLVEVDGLVLGGFYEVSGLQVEVEVQDYREGGVNDFVHRLPGPTRYPSNLVLRRGTSDRALWEWHEAIRLGPVEAGKAARREPGAREASPAEEPAASWLKRRDVSVLLTDDAWGEAWRWTFVRAYPIRWSGPELRADSAAVAVEAVELAHEGLSAPRAPELGDFPVLPSETRLA